MAVCCCSAVGLAVGVGVGVTVAPGVGVGVGVDCEGVVALAVFEYVDPPAPLVGLDPVVIGRACSVQARVRIRGNIRAHRCDGVP